MLYVEFDSLVKLYEALRRVKGSMRNFVGMRK